MIKQQSQEETNSVPDDVEPEYPAPVEVLDNLESLGRISDEKIQLFDDVGPTEESTKDRRR